VTRILITGASGLLGINVALQLSGKHQVTGVVYSQELKDVPFDTLQADLSEPIEVSGLVNEVSPELIINCAAMADLDACENSPEDAVRINTLLPEQLATLAKKAGMKFLHISTDAVFDGIKGGYTEDDIPNPVSVYARSKYEAEIAVQRTYPNALIARVNFYGFSLTGKRSLAEFFLYNLVAGSTMKGFTDVHFCPLLVQDLGEILVRMIEASFAGIYHVVSPEGISKHDFGVQIAKAFDLNEKLILPSSIADSNLKAPRSPNLTLRIDKLIHDLGITPPSQAQGIQRFRNLYKQGYPQKLKTYLA
jgi:dTDP-4-dehydrorhamnose reductase